MGIPLPPFLYSDLKPEVTVENSGHREQGKRRRRGLGVVEGVGVGGKWRTASCSRQLCQKSEKAV